jgi:hypothetical protein
VNGSQRRIGLAFHDAMNARGRHKSRLARGLCCASDQRERLVHVEHVDPHTENVHSWYCVRVAAHEITCSPRRCLVTCSSTQA